MDSNRIEHLLREGDWEHRGAEKEGVTVDEETDSVYKILDSVPEDQKATLNSRAQVLDCLLQEVNNADHIAQTEYARIDTNQKSYAVLKQELALLSFEEMVEDADEILGIGDDNTAFEAVIENMANTFGRQADQGLLYKEFYCDNVCFTAEGEPVFIDVVRNREEDDFYWTNVEAEDRLRNYEGHCRMKLDSMVERTAREADNITYEDILNAAERGYKPGIGTIS